MTVRHNLERVNRCCYLRWMYGNKVNFLETCSESLKRSVRSWLKRWFLCIYVTSKTPLVFSPIKSVRYADTDMNSCLNYDCWWAWSGLGNMNYNYHTISICIGTVFTWCVLFLVYDECIVGKYYIVDCCRAVLYQKLFKVNLFFSLWINKHMIWLKFLWWNWFCGEYLQCTHWRQLVWKWRTCIKGGHSVSL